MDLGLADGGSTVGAVAVEPGVAPLADRGPRRLGVDVDPPTTAAVTPSSHRCASTLRDKCLECCLPAESRYRARHWPSGRCTTLAIDYARFPDNDFGAREDRFERMLRAAVDELSSGSRTWPPAGRPATSGREPSPRRRRKDSLHCCGEEHNDCPTIRDGTHQPPNTLAGSLPWVYVRPRRRGRRDAYLGESCA